jgi:hypothetical protein
MIRIAITDEAFEAIRTTIPTGTRILLCTANKNPPIWQTVE